MTPAERAAPATLPAALRAGTAAQHARTEALVPILDPALTLDGYADVLTRFDAAYAPLEAALARVAWPEAFALAPRRKRPLLARDLAWLRARGVEPPAIAAGIDDGRTPSLPDAIGMLYVLEGATLGGQVILRRIGPRLGVDAEAGAAFFAGYGSATGAMWRAFGAMAERWGAAHPASWDACVASARATFDAIAARFER